jgi:enoyl-CoA hydratase/carnithine racemase
MTLRWTVTRGVGHLLLDDPPGNRMNRAFFDELFRFTKETLPRSGCRAVLVSGQGRHFSEGADVKSLAVEVSRPGGEDLLTDNLTSLNRIASFPVPVVAAVTGVCLGAAFELALACHIRIASESAVFGLPEATFGLIPGCGGLGRVAALAGRGRAAKLALGGGRFPAEQAHAWGLVDHVFPTRQVLAQATALARRLGQSPRAACYPEIRPSLSPEADA